MKFKTLPLLLAVALTALSVHAQDEVPGAQVTYQVNPSNCGSGINDAAPICGTINFGVGYSTWIDVNGHAQFQFFYGDIDLAANEDTVTSSSFSPSNSEMVNLPKGYTPGAICNGNCNTWTVTTTGTTPDDGGSVTITETFNLFHYIGGSSGRGGGGNRPATQVTGGSIVVTYN